MEGRNRNILIVLTGLVIVVAVFASFGLPLFSGPTPTITLPTPVPAGESPAAATEQTGGIRVEVTPATVQGVIAALSRLESYSRTVSITMAGASVNAYVHVDGGWTWALVDDARQSRTITGAGTVWRWYGNETNVVTWPADGSSADVDAQRIPTYEDVLALDKSAITAAGYQRKNGESCVYVEAAYPPLDQVERYWVSDETGLLTAAEVEAGGEVVWSMAADAPEIPVSSYASFTLPDGTVLHRVGESGS